jgi:hypothetical protein
MTIDHPVVDTADDGSATSSLAVPVTNWMEVVEPAGAAASGSSTAVAALDGADP